MENLILEATAHTPCIRFNKNDGTMEIKGRAIPDRPDEFWIPVLDWFQSYLIQPNKDTTFKLDMEYFNISSSKRILYLLYKLNDLAKEGYNVKVEWFYRKSDEDMYEVGQDYAYMVKVPFEFIEYNEEPILEAV